MNDGMTLTDDALGYAGEALIRAAELMVSGNVPRPPASIPSLTGIGADIDLHMRGFAVGRAALADAAKRTGELVASVMGDGDELDRTIASDLYAGFAVQGAPR